jgi:hypothetical protein
MRQPRRSLMDFSVPTGATAERPASSRSLPAASTRPLREPEPAASKAPRKPRERDMVAAAQPKERREAGATKRAAIGHNQPPVALEDVASAAIDMLSQYRNLIFAQMQSAMTASFGFANSLSAGTSDESDEGADTAPAATAPNASAIPADAIAPRELLRDSARRFWENELKLLDIMEDFATGWFRRRRSGTEAALEASQSMCMAPGATELMHEWHGWADGAAERLAADRLAVQRYLQGFSALVAGSGSKHE